MRQLLHFVIRLDYR